MSHCTICHTEHTHIAGYGHDVKPCDECGRPTCSMHSTPISNDPAHCWCVNCEYEAFPDCDDPLATNESTRRELHDTDMADTSQWGW